MFMRERMRWNAGKCSCLVMTRPEVTFEGEECPDCRSKADVHSDVELADRAALFERARVAGVTMGGDAAGVVQEAEDLGVEVCVGVGGHCSKLARRRGKSLCDGDGVHGGSAATYRCGPITS